MSAYDVVTMGESLALFTAETIGPLQHSHAFGIRVGGGESNVAIGLSRLGARVAWTGRLGDDALGRLVEREIRAEGVYVSAIIDGSAPTALMLKERRTGSVQSVIYYRAHSAGSRLCAEDIPGDLIRDARIIHLTGITPALSATALQAVHAAIAVAKRNETLVSFDLNYRSALWSRAEAAEFYREVIGQCDLVFAGHDEAQIVCQSVTPEENAHELRAMGAGLAIIKLGPDGALCASGADAVVSQHAIPVDVVDTVGAGDAFVAGFLADYLAGRSVTDCLKTAVTTGAFVCATAGDWEGAPRQSELALLTAPDPVLR